jgi:hypothetical protein
MTGSDDGIISEGGKAVRGTRLCGYTVKGLVEPCLADRAFSETDLLMKWAKFFESKFLPGASQTRRLSKAAASISK